MSHLTLTEVESVVGLISRLAPAGNIPGMIVNRLTRMPSKKQAKVGDVQRDINLLFKGVDKAFLLGPAAIIVGYQNMLKLVGKKPDDAFPEGTWQFYTSYALREDTARHANETHGFDTVLNAHNIKLSPIDRATAWVMASIYTLHQYGAILKNEWRERVYTYLLAQVTEGYTNHAVYARLFRQWSAIRPYGRGSDAFTDEPYPNYRHRKFDEFLIPYLNQLTPEQHQAWQTAAEAAHHDELPLYQHQMSLLAFLNPSAYNEERVPIDLADAHVCLIHQGRYYLIPACATDFLESANPPPADVETVRAQIATLMTYPVEGEKASLARLAGILRGEASELRTHLNPELRKEIDTLRLSPIIFNSDARSPKQPLATIRQTERGIGDHALTLFDTGNTIVFDQSHIFFDGAWGSALAEIMTNQALSWAIYLNTLPPAQPGNRRPYSPNLIFSPAEKATLRKASHAMPEVNAESSEINIKAMLTLRKLFKQRDIPILLTINDLLVLYRAIHAITYKPSPALINELKALMPDVVTKQAALAALNAIGKPPKHSPAILIPIDASTHSPRDRLHPLSLEIPLDELDLLNMHEIVTNSLNVYKRERSSRDQQATLTSYAAFDRRQQKYLDTLSSFGAILDQTKERATLGHTTSVTTIKMLAHIPAPLQRMLDKIPQNFDELNDLIKGREVFSNVGAVASDSTLTRFISAKDDNEQKTLVWGVLTTADQIMHITLRDFRPHVGMLLTAKQRKLATRITQEYLDAYVNGLNQYIRDLQHITIASQGSRGLKPKSE